MDKPTTQVVVLVATEIVDRVDNIIESLAQRTGGIGPSRAAIVRQLISRSLPELEREALREAAL